MKKRLIAILLVIFFLINIVAAAFIFVDIQAMKFPQATIRVDVLEVNSDEITVHHDIQMYNPNSFEMILKNLQIHTTTTSGDQVANITIEGGSIPGNSKKNFSVNDQFNISGDLSGVLTSTLSGTVGIKFLGIFEKTMPLQITVVTSIKEALEAFSLPVLHMHASFGTITKDAITLNTSIDIQNQNPVNASISGISITMVTETGRSVGSFTLDDATIPAKSSVTIHGIGTVLFEALNAKKLFINISANAILFIAGMNKSLPFSSTVEIDVPTIAQFIPTGEPLELAIKVDLSRGRGGLNGNMTLTVMNPTKIPLVLRDVTVTYDRVKNNEHSFVAVGPLGNGDIAPNTTVVFQGDIFLPYSKLFNVSAGGLIPDMIFAQLRANVSLSGVNQSLPVALGSYIDVKMFRPNQ
jgi:LEA14-like dessication related protein